MTREDAIKVTAALAVAVVAWNLFALSIHSLVAAMLVIVVVLYQMMSAEFRAKGLVPGRPIPKSAKWFLIFMLGHTVLGIAYSTWKYVL